MPGLISPAADFSAVALGRLVQLTSVRAGLVGEHLFGRNLATTAVNSAGAKVAGFEQLIGAAPAIVYGDHQIEVGNGAGFNTMIPGTLAETVLIVSTLASTNRPLSSASADAAALVGASFADPSRFAMLAGGGGNTTVAASFSGLGKVLPLPGVPTGDISKPRALAMRVGGTGIATDPMAIDEFMNGARTQGATSTVGAARAAPTFTRTVGNSSAIATNGQFQSRTLATAMLVWNRYLADADLLTAYLELRAQLTTWKAI